MQLQKVCVLLKSIGNKANTQFIFKRVLQIDNSGVNEHSFMIPRTGTIKELRMKIFTFIQKMKLDIAFFLLQHVFFFRFLHLMPNPRMTLSWQRLTFHLNKRHHLHLACRLTCVTYPSSHRTTFWEEITCFQMHGVMNGL